MTHSTVTHAEALRRLLAATKLIDYADCKDETVWQALGAAQGTAEGVLRDGEKQEPVDDWNAFRAWAEVNLGQGYSLDSEEGVYNDKVTRWCFKGFKAGRRHPAPSLQSVGAVPEGYALVPLVATDDMIVAFAEQWYSKRQVIDDPDMADAYKAMLAVAPQPAAAPSGDVERDAARYRWLREKRDIPHGQRNIPWVVALDPAEKIHTSVLRVGAELDVAIDAAMSKEKA